MPSALRQTSTSAVNFFFLVDIFTCVLGILILITLMLTTQANTSVDALAANSPVAKARQQKLSGLLDELSRLNAQNDGLQRSVTAAEAAPGLASLQSEIADMEQAIAAQRNQQATLRDNLSHLDQAGEKRDTVLGLTDLRHQVDQLKDESASRQAVVDSALAEMAQAEARVKEAEAALLSAKQLKDKLWLVPDRSQTTKEPLLVTVTERAIRVERFNRPSESETIADPHAADKFQDALKRFDPLNFYAVFYVKPSGIVLFEKVRDMAKDANFEVGYDALDESKNIIFSKPE